MVYSSIQRYLTACWLLSSLQVLITCLFPDTPRAANALISFNNRKAQSAIPGKGQWNESGPVGAVVGVSRQLVLYQRLVSYEACGGLS